MRGFLGARIAQIIPTLLLVSVLVFCLQQLMPGDPAGVETIGPILLTPDGKTCVYGYHRTLSDLYLVEGLK